MGFSRRLWWIGLLGLSLLTGCAGNGKGLDQSGNPIGSSSSSSGGSTGGGTVTADFQSIQDNVFTPICSKCHIGASAPEGLQLDAAHSYNLLVGVPSAEVPTLDRVKPGDPDHSYVVLKIEGAPGIVGDQMPRGETPLPQSTINAIRQWITDGALNNSSAALAAAISSEAANAFTVESTAPAEQAAIHEAPRHIAVAFTREVDASLVNDTTVALERIEPATGNASAVPFTVAPAASNAHVVIITPLTTLADAAYRVSLRGTGGAALADVDAHVLGSNISFTFTVETERVESDR